MDKQRGLKGQGKRPLAAYVEHKVIEPKTVRAPQELWTRVEAVAKRYEWSVNEAIVKALTKVCDDEEL